MIISQFIPLIFLSFLGFCYFLHTIESISSHPSSWKLNTSNQGKFEEFKHLFAQYRSTLEVSHIDLKEIDADPILLLLLIKQVRLIKIF